MGSVSRKNDMLRLRYFACEKGSFHCVNRKGIGAVYGGEKLRELKIITTDLKAFCKKR